MSDIEYNIKIKIFLNNLGTEISNKIILKDYKNIEKELSIDDKYLIFESSLPNKIKLEFGLSPDRTLLLEYILKHANFNEYILGKILKNIFEYHEIFPQYMEIFENLFSKVLNLISNKSLLEPMSILGNYYPNNEYLLESIINDKEKHWALKPFYNKVKNINFIGKIPTIVYISKFIYMSDEIWFSLFRTLLDCEMDINLKNEKGNNFLFTLLSLGFNKFSLEGCDRLKKLYYIMSLNLDINNSNHNGDNLAHIIFSGLQSSSEVDKNYLNYVLKLLEKNNYNKMNKLGLYPIFYLTNIECWKYISHLDMGWDKKTIFNKTIFDNFIKSDDIFEQYFDKALIDYKDNEFFDSFYKSCKEIFLAPIYQTKENEKIFNYPLTKAWCSYVYLNNNIFEKIHNYLNIKHSSKIINNDDTKEKTSITCELYSKDDFKKFAKSVKKTNKEESKKFVEKSQKISNIKTFAKSDLLLKEIESLSIRFPHFIEVIEHIENHCILQNKGDKVFYLPPILLTGGAGIGKTFFCHTLAEILETHFEVFNMEGMTAGFEISGLSEGWSSAAPGKIFKILTETSNINPIMLLDEIDKVADSDKFNPVNVLLPLLEKYTAKNFKDECIQLKINASHIVWIATANELGRISTPIKSRFDIFNIPNPNFTQRKTLVNEIYKTILKNNTWGKSLDTDLSEDITSAIADTIESGGARTLRRDITTACAKAVKNNRNVILLSDINTFQKQPKMLWDLALDN